MIMKQIFRIVLIAFVGLSLGSCDVGDDESLNFKFVPLQIVSADLPDAFELNKTYKISVTFTKPSNCVFFEGFDITQSSTTVRNVVAIGSEIEDTNCTQETEAVVTSFNFICIYSDTYLFRFYTGDDSNGEPRYLEIEVPVVRQ